jgi:hypothetical protein
MKPLSHLRKLSLLITFPSQQFCACGVEFNVMKLMKSTIEIGLMTSRLDFFQGHFTFAILNPSQK